MKPEPITALSLILYAMYAINPSAAAGAAFGCVFHLALPSCSGYKGLAIAIASFGLGYASGISVGGDNTMLASAVVSAMGGAMLISIHAFISGGKEVPAWITAVVNLMRSKK